MGNATLKELVSVTRSGGVATRWNEHGLLQTVPADRARITHDPATRDTSTTSLSFTRGTKTVTVSGAVTYRVGWIVRVTDQQDVTRWMLGKVKAVSGNDVTLDVRHDEQVNGTGSGSSWYVLRSLGILAEDNRTNSLLDNRDLSTGNWTEGNSISISKNATGLDGAANTAHTLTDNNASGFSNIVQSMTVSDNSNTHVALFPIKKDSNTSRFPILDTELKGGTTTLRYRCWFNTSDGSIQAAGDASSSDITVIDAGDWWLVSVNAANNGTGNTSLEYRMYPAGGTTIGTTDASATGSIVYDFGGARLNASIFGSPIETGSSTVTVNGDDLEVDVSAYVQAPHTIIIKATVHPESSGSSAFDTAGGADSGPAIGLFVNLDRQGDRIKVRNNQSGDQTTPAVTWPSDGHARYAIAYDVSGAIHVFNGTDLGPGPSMSPLPAWSVMGLHKSNGVVSPDEVTIESIEVFNRKLSVSELQDKTA